VFKKITAILKRTFFNIDSSAKTPLVLKVEPNRRIKTERKKDFQEKNNWHISQFVVHEKEGSKRFHDFPIPHRIMHAIQDLNFQYCTPIQSGIMSFSISGHDGIGQAQTGTGKTAAFLVTIFARAIKEKLFDHLINSSPAALIIAPTRELAIQITEDALLLSKYFRCNIVSVYGGMDYNKQINLLKRKKVDLLVATPGRLLDFINQKIVSLKNVKILIIDEADKMLDMGFIPDVRKIVRYTSYGSKRQTLFFSATMTDEVRRLSSYWTTKANIIEIEPERKTLESIEEKIYLTASEDKFSLLYNIISKEKPKRVLIFCNRKDETKLIYDKLFSLGFKCGILSGDIDQRKRLTTLDKFKEAAINVLVATDVAGRGIHVEGIDYVINYNLPVDGEDYIHRIGRTGRAGANGIAISFACDDDSFNIPSIEKALERKLVLLHPEDELLLPPPEHKIERSAPPKRKGSGQRGPNQKRKFVPNRRKQSNSRNKGKSG